MLGDVILRMIIFVTLVSLFDILTHRSIKVK